LERSETFLRNQDPDRTQTGLAGCEIAPILPDAASPIRYLTIRVWLAGIECNSIN
jgi:hypothetical protein